MGITAHNRQRREQEARGQGGEVTRAQAHYDAATKRVADLTAALAQAKTHQAEMKKALEAATPKPEKAAKKAPAKKGK
jgi:hypothetical protein